MKLPKKPENTIKITSEIAAVSVTINILIATYITNPNSDIVPSLLYIIFSKPYIINAALLTIYYALLKYIEYRKLFLKYTRYITTSSKLPDKKARITKFNFKIAPMLLITNMILIAINIILANLINPHDFQNLLSQFGFLILIVSLNYLIPITCILILVLQIQQDFRKDLSRTYITLFRIDSTPRGNLIDFEVKTAFGAIMLLTVIPFIFMKLTGTVPSTIEIINKIVIVVLLVPLLIIAITKP